MDVTLTKFIAILVLIEITNYVIAIPIKDSTGYAISRDKRSPSNNFPLFGFGIKTPFSVPNPITSVHENYKNLANLFRPAIDLSQNEYNTGKHNFNSAQKQNEANKNNFIISKPDEVPHEANETKNRGPVPPPNVNNNNKSGVSTEIINDIKGNHVVQENNDTKDITKLVLKAVANNADAVANKTVTVNPETTINIMTEENDTKHVKMNIDKKLLDYIFNTNILDDTTADTTETGDYTTETGDYKYTTTDGTDDLLRIPGPVVASLLG